MSELISKQAVLNTLDNMDKALDEDRTVETYKALLTECIKVLPSAEIKGDLISRQAVLDEMDKRHAEGDCITKGFIKALPSVENKGDVISRDSILTRVRLNYTNHQTVERHEIEDIIKSEPSAENKGEWIPCSERLPEDLEIVNV